MMDGGTAGSGGHEVAVALRQRLTATPPGRLRDAVELLVDHAFQIISALRVSPVELDALVQFLTDVGYATDARRQEWVLLADVFGLSEGTFCGTLAEGPRVTPSTFSGPFYRADAPRLPLGANLCRNGMGEPLAVSGRIMSAEGGGIGGAEIEVWHADASGRYENQDPDNQPEHNLRGRLAADAEGRFHFATVRPGGYSLPDDGPVGQLARRLGLSLDRPAHIHFAVSAPGHRRLVTAIFDGSDPAIDRDALFAVKPGLIGEFRSANGRSTLDVVLVLDTDATPKPMNDEKG